MKNEQTSEGAVQARGVGFAPPPQVEMSPLFPANPFFFYPVSMVFVAFFDKPALSEHHFVAKPYATIILNLRPN